MAAEIVMPKVDMVMEDGTFIEWLKQEGEFVNKGDPLFVIGTDKADIEVEAPASGHLAHVAAKRDDVIPVSTVIGYIVQPGEQVDVADGTAPATTPQSAPEPVAATAPAPEHEREHEHGDDDASGKIRATPLARAQARALGLDLAEIPGSGPRGRIHKADVARYASTQETVEQETVEQESVVQESVVQESVSPAQRERGAWSQWPAPDPNLHVRGREPLKGARGIIAERLALSASTIPHIHLTVQVDMSEAARLRERVNPVLAQDGGRKASYTALIARAVATLLPQHPYLNSSLINNEIVQWQEVNLGIATNQTGADQSSRLIVPVIRNAERMNLAQLVQEMARLLDLTRAHKLAPADMKGSTFTISNLGMMGISAFTAIINPPEAAILAVGQIQDTPVAHAGEVAIRPVAALTLAADHRIIDGAGVTRFLGDLKRVLENPYLLI